jgi:CHRD domain-containing protein
MMRAGLFCTRRAAIVFVSQLAATSAFAASISFRAELNGANVVPPIHTPARDYLDATYNTVTRRLSWTGTQSGLSSKITAVHFHAPACPNKTAAVAKSIESLGGGSAALSEAEAADLIAGTWYIDIHTRAHPEGEIRGQVMRGE